MNGKELAKVRELLKEIADLGKNPQGFHNPLCIHETDLLTCGRRAKEALALLDQGQPVADAQALSDKWCAYWKDFWLKSNHPESPDSSPVADGAREIAEKIVAEAHFIQPRYLSRLNDEAAALITQAMREELKKAAERAVSWYKDKDSNPSADSLRAAIMGGEGE